MKEFATLHPHFLHGADYNAEQWRNVDGIWDEDMRLMRLAACNEMTVGIFSWAKLEPKEGVYDFSFLDEIIEKVAKNNGKIILATPSGARPHWLADAYGEVLRVDEHGVRQTFGGRHNHCYTSPVYREKVQSINRLLAQRYGKNPTVVAWHISNEYGGKCYCPLCQDAFRAYLKKRYDNDIQKLNHAYWSDFWSHTYDSFEQIEPPTPLISESSENSSDFKISSLSARITLSVSLAFSNHSLVVICVRSPFVAIAPFYIYRT